MIKKISALAMALILMTMLCPTLVSAAGAIPVTPNLATDSDLSWAAVRGASDVGLELKIGGGYHGSNAIRVFNRKDVDNSPIFLAPDVVVGKTYNFSMYVKLENAPGENGVLVNLAYAVQNVGVHFKDLPTGDDTNGAYRIMDTQWVKLEVENYTVEDGAVTPADNNFGLFLVTWSGNMAYLVSDVVITESSPGEDPGSMKPAVEGNLVLNGCFEEEIEGVFAYADGTVVRTSTEKFEGEYSLKMARTNYYDGILIYTNGLVSTRRYDVSFWIKVPAPDASVPVSTRFVFNGEEQTYLIGTQIIPESDWVSVVFNDVAFVYSKEIASEQLFIQFEGGTVEEFYLDDISIVEHRELEVKPDRETPIEEVFTDLPLEWYRASIAYCYDKGLVSGVGGDLFAPEGLFTRGQVVRLLWNIAGNPKPIGEESPFSDITQEWVVDAAIWAYENGLLDENIIDDSGHFHPDDSITKERTVYLFYLYQQISGRIPLDVAEQKDYSDWNDVADYAKTAINALTLQGIVQGSGESFDPQGIFNRAMIAELLAKYYKALE